ncbi:hypothetical protein ES703_90057 [subsurface metagenome]
MDIRNWPMNRIMQLPDNCFGRRFPVCVCVFDTDETPRWDISEIALPEKCVIWGFTSWMDEADYHVDSFRLALGDQLPTTVAMMDALEPLFYGLGRQGPEPRYIVAHVNYPPIVYNLRLPVAAAGRRVILEARSNVEQALAFQVVLVVSSIPTEVPDCLLSV